MKQYLHAGMKAFRNRRSLYTLLSFLIPFLAVLTAFIVQQVHPFGSKMILTVDLYHQYAPFAVELRNKILSGESLLYSWNIGLGSNFLATMANYAASPLNLLLLFFPTKFISDGIALIVCIRAGLSGLFMSFLLRDIDKGRKDLFLCGFASFYALCGWVLSYFWNIMWMDAVVLLPLIVFGMRRMFRDGKPFLYSISLFLCLLSNFFTGYFVCIFLILYAPVCYVTAVEKKTPLNFFQAAGRFSLFSILGGGLAGVLLYPTYIALGHASATGDAFPKENYLTHDMFDFFSRLFLSANPNIRGGMANVYSGVLVLLMIPLFFLCSRIRLKEKISYGILLLVMYFSFASRFLDFIWHGFHFPNQIPHRQAFLMSFLLVIIGYRVLRNLKSFTVSDLTISSLLIFSYLVLYEKIGEGAEGFRAIALTGLFILIYTVVLRIIIASEKGRKVHRYVLFGVLLAELIVASQVTIGLVSMNEGFTGWDFYGKKSGEIRSFLDEKANEPGIGPFVRAEIYPAYICNQPALYDMKGLSIFSSTARESQVKFMKSMGFHNNGINSTRNFGLTEVTASLFGIRYLVDLETQSAIPTVFDTPEQNEYDLRIMKNPHALSLGYMVSSAVLDYEVAQKSDVFAATNEFLTAIGVGPVYVAEEIDPGTLEHAEFTSGNKLAGYAFKIDKDQDRASIEFTVTGERDGRQLYVFENSGRNVSAEVAFQIDEATETSLLRSQNRSNQIIDLGNVTDDMKSVKLIWNDDKNSNITVYCYSVDPVAYENMTAELGASQLTITSFETTRFEGEVETDEAGVLLLTMTYDEGWKAWIDGEAAEVHNVAGALCGISLTEGKHKIVMKYEPDGFRIGIAFSLGSLVLLVSTAVVGRLIRRRRESWVVRRSDADEVEFTPVIAEKNTEELIIRPEEDPEMAGMEGSTNFAPAVAENSEMPE
ncbi:MAG: YfhO family protein [Clostridiales bacterium]|nr:YfhO family protein [Clostridiales bacterium]